MSQHSKRSELVGQLTAPDTILCDELTSRITGIEGWLNPSGPRASAPSAVDLAPKPLNTEAEILGIGKLTVAWDALFTADRREGALPYPIYAGVQPLDADLSVLEHRKDWMTLGEIATALQGGGVTFQKSATRVISYQLTTCLRAGGPLERTEAQGNVRWQWRSQIESDEPETRDSKG